MGTGNKWKIPVAWSIIIRYITPPILAIIVSFAYPAFYLKRYDPLHIFAFTIAHLVMCITAVGFIVPRWFDVFIPLEKLNINSDMYTPTQGVFEPQLMGVQDHEKGHGTGAKASPSTSLD